MCSSMLPEIIAYQILYFGCQRPNPGSLLSLPLPNATFVAGRWFIILTCCSGPISVFIVYKYIVLLYFFASSFKMNRY